jgi:hypothetical protein
LIRPAVSATSKALGSTPSMAAASITVARRPESSAETSSSRVWTVGARRRARSLKAHSITLRERVRERLAAGELRLAQQCRKLDQRERIAAGALDQTVPHRRRERRPDALGQQLVRRYPVESPERQLGQARCLELSHAALERREQQNDAFGLEPACGKGERVGRWLIEPVRVVDHRQQRCLFGRLGEQTEDADTDEADSASIPTDRRTRMSVACSSAYASSADFPTPGSPRTRSAPLCDDRAPVTSLSTAAASTRLP